MTNSNLETVTLRDLGRWFSHRPLLAERTALALCRHMAGARGDLDLTSPGAWLDWVRGYRIDTAAHSEAWTAWRLAGAQEANYPNRQHYRVPIWTRAPPLPDAQWLYGQDWKQHPRNTCPVCRCRTYAAGDWREAAGVPRWNRLWHACCASAHAIWRDPTLMALYLADRQGGRCPITREPLLGWHPRGGPNLLGDVQVDHIVPLWRVRVDAAQHRWPDVLRFWGPRNLQTLSLAGHREKTTQEASERATLAKAATPAQLSFLAESGTAVDPEQRDTETA